MIFSLSLDPLPSTGRGSLRGRIVKQQIQEYTRNMTTPNPKANIPQFQGNDFISGMTMPLTGFAFLFKNGGLKRYAVLPLLANVILYILALVLLFWLIGRWQIGTVEWDFWGPVGGWLTVMVNWLKGGLKILAGLVAVMVAFFTFTGVGMVLASPLNDLLSEKVENVYCGSEKKLNVPIRFTVQAALLSAWDSLKNLVKQMFFSILCLPLLLIPVVGFIPLFLVGSYFAGFGYIDTAMARNFLRARHKRVLTKNRFWKILGLGVTMQILFFIPLLGLLLLPVGVTAGTLIYCGEDWQTRLREAGLEPPSGFIAPIVTQS